jgi:glycosyltransferase involved in cell wall biosynthesis
VKPTILVAHNYYQQPGGEDEVFRGEAWLLETRGHRVVRYSLSNSDIPQTSRPALARATLWNSKVYQDLGRLLREEPPALVHFHNTFPLMSPAAYYAARDEGVRVVQTLHNYRLLCPNGLLYRDSEPCELCVGKAVAWPGIVHACYRRSRSASAVAAAMLSFHRARGTWTGAVDMYIALTEFARHKFIEGGIPAERIMVKPNFLTRDPGAGHHGADVALFVGRLSPEKGVHTLIRAWRQVRPTIRLQVVGDGPLYGGIAQSPGNVQWLGHLTTEGILSLMKEAALLVLPSEAYENFPLTALQAFATGLPVIASGHGALAEIVEDGKTGRLFEPGDPDDLASTVEWALDHPDEMAAMGRRARAEYENKYTPERNYDILMRVYEAACGASGRSPGVP